MAKKEKHQPFNMAIKLALKDAAEKISCPHPDNSSSPYGSGGNGRTDVTSDDKKKNAGLTSAVPIDQIIHSKFAAKKENRHKKSPGNSGATKQERSPRKKGSDRRERKNAKKQKARPKRKARKLPNRKSRSTDQPRSLLNCSNKPQFIPKKATPRLAKPHDLVWGESTVVSTIFREHIEEYTFNCKRRDWDNFSDTENGSVELVIGLDFGTTFTKVVITENGSKRSWAVPLSNNAHNPYLLSSAVYIMDNSYSLTPSGERKFGLKFPFLSGESASQEDCGHAIAFIALVVQYAKQWFLNKHSEFLMGGSPFWFVNVGLPSKDYEQSIMMERYQSLVWGGVSLSTVNSNERIDGVSALSAYKVANSAIRSGQKYIRLQGGISVHREQVCVYPEIMAQVYGFVRSHHWDAKKPEFMLVDVGGGTLDSTIFNVNRDHSNSNLKFSIFSSRVRPRGTINLHKLRIDWLKSQIGCKDESSRLASELYDLERTANIMWKVPNQINSYLENANFGEYTVDDEFLNALREECLTDQLKYVLEKIIPNFHRRGESYPIILAGGGSVNELYKGIFEAGKVGAIQGQAAVEVSQLQLPIPQNLEAPHLSKGEYHRLSVGYGLSFDNLGVVLTPDKISDLHLRQESGEDRLGHEFVSKDML